MKKILMLFAVASVYISSNSQIDTISENVYQDNGNLGIGINNPAHTLQINDDIGSGIERNLLRINNLSNGVSSYTGMILKTGADDYQSVIQDYGLNYIASPYYDFGGFLNLSNNSNGLMLHANSPGGIIKFYTGHDETAGAGIERLRIDSAGNIGINTNKPVTKLQVADGDIYISDIEKGIIMKSPDGNCWRGVLDNTGQLIFEQIDCPEEVIQTELQHIKSSKSVMIFPNPTNNSINISISLSQIEKPKYEIYNLNGKLLLSGKIKSDLQTINISAFANGAYILSVFNKRGNRIASEKIIKE